MLPACLAALVLLLDTSASLSDRHFAEQRDGTAAAFEDPRVIAAIAASAGVAVLAAEFGYGARVRIGWRVIRDAAGALAFAAALRELPREDRSGQTAIGFALDFARREMARPPCLPRVSVIDISTDGVESLARIPPRQAREAAAAEGIAVNALLFSTLDRHPPEADAPGVLQAAEAWLRENVVTGFVRVLAPPEGYAAAFREKFLAEIAALPAGR